MEGPPGKTVAVSGDGWSFLIDDSDQSAHFHLEEGAFTRDDVLPATGEEVWLRRKSDNTQFLVYDNLFYEVMGEAPVAPDAAFIKPGDRYFVVQNLIDDSDLRFFVASLDGNHIMYKVQGIEECTGDANCPHCASCTECATMGQSHHPH